MLDREKRRERQRFLRKQLQDKIRPVVKTGLDLKTGKKTTWREPEYESSPVVLDHDKPKFGKNLYRESDTTIHDILQNLTNKRERRFSRRRGLVNQALDEIAISSQVREQWQARLNPIKAQLTDSVRAELVRMPKLGFKIKR